MTSTLPLDRVLADQPDPTSRKEPTVATATAPTEAPKKGGKGKLIVVLVALLAIGGALYYFLLGGSSSEAAAAPKPGEVVAVEPMTLNLSDGHYLKLGLGIRLVEGADSTKFDTSEAADAAIALYSDKAMTDLASAEAREAAKKTYVETIKKSYEDEIYDVYYTTFVMQ